MLRKLKLKQKNTGLTDRDVVNADVIHNLFKCETADVVKRLQIDVETINEWVDCVTASKIAEELAGIAGVNVAIIDDIANIGVYSHAFAKHFVQVGANESRSHIRDMLVHNIEVFGDKNVTINNDELLSQWSRVLFLKNKAGVWDTCDIVIQKYKFIALMLPLLEVVKNEMTNCRVERILEFSVCKVVIIVPVIVAPFKTTKMLTKYEFTKAVGVRATQLSDGAPSTIADMDDIDPIKIAMIELDRGVFPFIIKRELPGGEIENININDLIIPPCLRNLMYK